MTGGGFLGRILARARGNPAGRSREGKAWDHSPPTAQDEAARQQEGRFLRKLWQSSREQWQRMAVIAVLIWIAYALLLSPSGTLHLMRLRAQARRIDHEVGRLEAARDSLLQAIAALESGDARAAERVAREELGFVRDNERIYMLPKDAEDRRFIDRSRRPDSP